MDYRRSGNSIVVRLDSVEELLAKLCELAEREDIGFAYVDGFGTSRELSLSYTNTEDKTWYRSDYADLDFVLPSIKGILVRRDGVPAADLYAVAANPAYGRESFYFVSVRGFAVGGKINSARVSTQCALKLDVLDIDAALEPTEYQGFGRLVFAENE